MNPIIALIIANLIWGAASPIFKYALENIPPFTLAFIRFFGASIVILPFVLSHRQRITLRDIFEICLSAFFGITINITFFFLGLKKATSINAPIIASAGPVFLYLLSIVFLKEKPIRKVFIGMMIALMGVFVIILSPLLTGNGQFVVGEMEGNFLFVLAMIGAVLSTLFNKEVLRRVNPYLVSLIGFLFGSMTFIPFMPQEWQSWGFHKLNLAGWTGIIYGIFFSSALAYCLLNIAVAKINAEEVGIFTYIDPIAAVVVAMPLVHEYPDFYFFIGSALVFGGIFLAEGRIHWHPLEKLKAQILNDKSNQKFK